MSKGTFQQVIILGALGQDPEVKYMPNGNAVANLSVATNESWKDKNTGQMQEKTEWHRVVIFGKLAEVAGQHLQKGSKVMITGKLQTRKWQDQSGQDKYTTEVVVDMGGAMQMLGGGQGQQQGQQVGGFSQPQGQMNQAQAGQAQGNHQGGYQQQQPQQQAQQRQAQAQPNQPYNQGQQQGQQAQQGQYQSGNQQQQSGYQQQQMQQRNAQARQQAQQGQMNQAQQGQQQGQQPQGGMDFDDIPFAPIGLQHKALLSCI